MPNRREFLSSVSAGVVGLAIAGRPGRVVAADDAPVTLAWPTDVSGWDPSASSTPATLPIHRSVFDTPLNISLDFKLEPGLATAHRWLDKEAKTLELTIREGVTFHNGDPLTADDFHFTFYERPKADPKLNLSGTFGKIVRDVEIPAPMKVIFHFNEPYLEGLPLLATTTPYLVPRKYFEKVGQDGFMEKPIGTGPYKLVNYQRNTLIALEAYDKYWRGPAKIKRLNFRIIKDRSARIAAIQSGQVDFVDNIPVRDVPRLGALPNLVGELHPITAVILVHMVNKGIYQDRNVRLALHHAVDKQALSNAFFGGKALPASMYASRGLVGNDPNFEFPYSQDKARELLAKSGYTASNPAKVTLGTLNGVFTGDFDIARALVQMWKQVGIDVELKVFEPAQYFEVSRSNKLEHPFLYMWTDTTGDPQMLSGLLLDPSKRYSIWKSDDVAARMAPLFREVDDDKRNAGYRAFDVWAVEQGYEVPLLQTVATIVHTKRLNYVPRKNGWVLPYEWSLKDA